VNKQKILDPKLAVVKPLPASSIQPEESYTSMPSKTKHWRPQSITGIKTRRQELGQSFGAKHWPHREH
jgi:hypothetical protein